MAPAPDDTMFPPLPLCFDVKLDLELRKIVHRDCGVYYKRLNLIRKAIDEFDAGHKLNENDIKPLIELSDCKLRNADCKESLMYAEKAVNLEPNNVLARYQLIDSLYDGDQFENCLKFAVNTKHDIPRADTIKKCNDYIDICDSTIQQTVGYGAGPCLFRARKIINKIMNADAMKIHDKRPVWKILKDRNECDATSQRAVKKEHISPQCAHRRRLNFSVLNHMYFDFLTAYDIQYLRDLKTESNFVLTNSNHKQNNLVDVLEDVNDRLITFKSILKSRDPFYSKRFAMIKTEKKSADYKETNLFRVQYQTRRDVFCQLVHIKKLSSRDNLSELIQYIDHILTYYYSVKSKRIFPRKSEFINEICNIVGLTYLNRLKIPVNLMEIHETQHLSILLELPKEVQYNPNHKIGLGDRTTFVDPTAPDYVYISYKLKLDHLEYRIELAKTRAELCFLYHEIAWLHFSQHKVDEAKVMGKRLVHISKDDSNCVWMFLGYIMMIRIEIMQRNYGQVTQHLLKLKTLATKMPEHNQHFIETIMVLFEDEINFQKETNQKQNP